MIVRFTQWYGARTVRERRMLQLMAAIAIPLLVWLLLVLPLANAYEDSLQRQLRSVDRFARVKMLAARAAGSEAQAPAAVPDLGLFLTDSARQRGLTAQAQAGTSPGSAAITIAAAGAPVALDWLRALEEQGYRASDVRVTPTGDGTVAVTATLSGAAL